MTGSLLTNKRLRKEFGSKRKIIDIPDLIGMQRNSFESFLQRDIPPQEREEKGLHAVFKSVFPIKDFTDTSSLEYVSYSFGETKHSMKECISRGMTYDIPVNIRVRLVVYDHDKETNLSTIRDIKEQEIYFGTIPLMTRRGTFIINGTERAVVSQLHRSSGVFFDHDKGKNYSTVRLSITPASSRSAVPGLTWKLTPRTSSISALTGVVNFRFPFCLKPLDIPVKIS
jgi:DNA-directed RNA polymerase subunit beta